MTRLAVAQLCADQSPALNLDRAIWALEQARAQNCTAVCLPECCLTGYYPDRARQLAIRADDPLLDRLASAARAQRVDALIGYMELKGDRLYITHSLLRQDGLRAHYRKTHLGQRERIYFDPGDRLEVFDLSCGLRAGVQLCLEAHFPEITQALSLRGAQVVFAPHASPMSAQRRREVWHLLMPARAYDNRVYMACCNQWDGARYNGGCLLAAPNGTIAAERWQGGAALMAFDVDEAELARYRAPDADIRHRYYPTARRSELY